MKKGLQLVRGIIQHASVTSSERTPSETSDVQPSEGRRNHLSSPRHGGAMFAQLREEIHKDGVVLAAEAKAHGAVCIHRAEKRKLKPNSQKGKRLLSKKLHFHLPKNQKSTKKTGELKKKLKELLSKEKHLHHPTQRFSGPLARSHRSAHWMHKPGTWGIRCKQTESAAKHVQRLA